jgi:L-galactonate dehydratase
MNDAGDYSSAYCILQTDDNSLTGHGMVPPPALFLVLLNPTNMPAEQTFTIGRGNDIVCKAIDNLALRLHGKTLEELTENMGKTWRYLVADSQLRWIGPEVGFPSFFFIRFYFHPANVVSHRKE